MDIRIGITQAPREIAFEAEDSTREHIKAEIDKALRGEIATLWVTDKKGRDIAVPSAKIAYVEIGSGEDSRRIGFGG